MFKKIVVLTQLLFFVHSACISKEIFLHNYLKEGEKDVTMAVYEMLQDARKYNSAKIIIDAGEYHFYPEKAFEKYCCVSNHDNTMRRIAFPLIGFDELEIQGNNVRFIFHGVMMPFDIEDSRNIKISGITIDWHIPLHSEALIVANNQIEGTFDLSISGQYPYVVRDKELIFIKEGYEHDLGNAILFDPNRKAVTYNTSYYTPVEQTSRIPVRYKDQFDYQNYVDIKAPIYAFQDAVWNLEAREIEPGLVRIKTRKPVPPVGMVLVCKGRNGNNRIANAFHIIKSNDVELTNIKIHHAGGMGIIGERSQNIRLEKVTVEASPGKGRMVSTTADATHFVNCRGTILLNNCTFRHMLDDATNVHGSFVIVDKVLSKNRIGIRVGHFQQAGFIFAERGDKLGFINSNESTVPEFTATVKSVETINDRYYVVTFDEPIDREVNSTFVLENLDWYPELVITNNIIADNRARGILLSTPKRTVVENNYFSNMMSAIFIPVELSWWYESGQAQDVIIRNNRFGDCCYGGGKRPVILIHSAIGESDFAFGKIVIENNDFKSFDASILQANGVRELSFINNKIQASGTFVPLFPNEPVLKLEQIGSLRLNSNEYDGNLEDKTELKNISFRL